MPRRLREVPREIERLDVAVYAAVAATPTPVLDAGLARLSRAADKGALWFGVAGLLALGGPRGRRAAVEGLGAQAVTSVVINLVLKPMGGRHRPDRAAHQVPVARHVAMPRSTSWPSGHAGSAFAFASGVGASWPAAGLPCSALATLVAYSRVHTGVHYPLDTIVGSVTGAALTPIARAAAGRRRRS